MVTTLGFNSRDTEGAALKRGGRIEIKGRRKVLDVSVSPFRVNIYTKQVKKSERQKQFSFCNEKNPSDNLYESSFTSAGEKLKG